MDNEAPMTTETPFKRALDDTISVLNQTRLVTGTRRQIFTGALLGTCLVFLATMLGLPHLDAPLTVALYAFAIASPCLAIEFAVTTYGKTTKTETPMPIQPFFDLYAATMILLGDTVGAIAALVGIGAVLAHFAPAVLVVSLATLIGMPLIYGGATVVAYVVAIVRYKRQTAKKRTPTKADV